MKRTAVPKLLRELQVTVSTIQHWAGDASRAAVTKWKDGAWGPIPTRRAALVVAVRRHAARLLALAEAVEREAKAADARRTAVRGTGGR